MLRWKYAGVAELADAQASGACGGNPVMVRLHSPALGGKFQKTKPKLQTISKRQNPTPWFGA
jgi:hypothetical protein